MSIMAYNGSACVAMVGKDCVALAADSRYGIQQQTISNDFQRIYQVSSKAFVALPGLATDVQTVVSKINFRKRLYELKEERQMRPKVLSNLVSSMLYERRFGPYFVEPIIAGLEKKKDLKNDQLLNIDEGLERVKKERGEEEKEAEDSGEYVPYICAMDLIGAQVFTDDFLVGGTASEQLYGVCEALFKPQMSKEQLFETVSQCLLASIDRDCLSGWGAVVYLITADGVTIRKLKTRQD